MTPDLGAPVTEESRWTQKERAFDPLVEDEEEQEIQRQQQQQQEELDLMEDEEEELMSVYMRGESGREGGRILMKYFQEICPGRGL